jgi:histone-lysine N-methyltransferase SETDB1
MWNLVHTRSRNLRSREPVNKKETKKSNSKSTRNEKELNRTLLPDYDGVVYTLDAKLIGNIGRYFNHSCSPNIAVQNVFVDVRLEKFFRLENSNLFFIDAWYSFSMDWIFYYKNYSSRNRIMVKNFHIYSKWIFDRSIYFSWDYNYTVGEIAGRRLDCNCGSSECRRRVL